MKKLFPTLTLLCVFILNSCDKSHDGTVPTIPTLLTSPLSFMTAVSVTSGGEISADGGSSIIARGICWNTTPNPTILNNKTSEGSGAGTFTSVINGLTDSTVYYFRAYATNGVGTAYGNEIGLTFYSSVVTICSDVWMDRNLDVAYYRNGDPIPQVKDPAAWASLTTGAYCYVNNDSATNAAIYGKLYNWYAVMDPRGLAPVGWHVPSDAEWKGLARCIDPIADTTCQNCYTSLIAGGAMKEAGTAHWLSSDAGATNSSGFTGLPGGYRYGSGYGSDGIFTNTLGYYGIWWSTSETTTTNVSVRELVLNTNRLHSTDRFTKQHGFSVRCKKDN